MSIGPTVLATGERTELRPGSALSLPAIDRAFVQSFTLTELNCSPLSAASVATAIANTRGKGGRPDPTRPGLSALC